MSQEDYYHLKMGIKVTKTKYAKLLILRRGLNFVLVAFERVQTSMLDQLTIYNSKIHDCSIFNFSTYKFIQNRLLNRSIKINTNY